MKKTASGRNKIQARKSNIFLLRVLPVDDSQGTVQLTKCRYTALNDFDELQITYLHFVTIMLPNLQLFFHSHLKGAAVRESPTIPKLTILSM